MSKVLNGFLQGGAALAGNMVAKKVNAALPAANIPITQGKAINIASFAGGSLVSGFAPGSGMIHSLIQGFGNGLAAGSDPVASALGGGAMRPTPGAQYGSIGV